MEEYHQQYKKIKSVATSENIQYSGGISSVHLKDTVSTVEGIKWNILRRTDNISIVLHTPLYSTDINHGDM